MNETSAEPYSEMADRTLERIESTSILLEYLFDRWDDPDVGSLLIRLTVLYEDLRLECRAGSASDLGSIDVNGVRYRQFYFHRRAYATLQEIQGALNQLNASSEFCAHIKAASEVSWHTWCNAIAFFNDHSQVIKKRRNTFGGHFGNQAASVARRMMMPSSLKGRMACHLDHDRQLFDPSHLFALELSTLVFFEDVDARDSKTFSAEAEKFIETACAHAGNAFLAISEHCFVPHFSWPPLVLDE
jgi:hypothetical protein